MPRRALRVPAPRVARVGLFVAALVSISLCLTLADASRALAQRGARQEFAADAGHAVALVLLVLIGLASVVLHGHSAPFDTPRARRRSPRRRSAERKWAGVDVGIVHLALDVPGAPRGLRSVAPGDVCDLDAARLRSLALELRHAREEWTHVGGASHKPMSAAMAEGLFDGAADSTLSALANAGELIGSGDGDYRTEVARTESVVVLIVASREEIRDFDARSASDVAKTLWQFGRTSNDALVHAQVIWRAVELDPPRVRGLGLTAIEKGR